MITQIELDNLVEKFETREFIKSDPIQFPHRYKRKEDIELAGFISSLLAYGSRKQFIQKLDTLFVDIAQNKPFEFISNFDADLIGEFNYRFGKSNDFIEIFSILKKLYNTSRGLEELFEYSYSKGKLFEGVVDYFYSNTTEKASHGFYHMIPNPKNGGAMKRMCMFLRWMVRNGEVDLGIWKFMKASELYIPLDVHVGRISRKMGLLKRGANDFKAVEELTENLKLFCPSDPIKYDFALFGYGVNEVNLK